MGNTLAPAVVLKEGEKCKLIREREKPAHLAEHLGYYVSTLK